MIKYISVKHPGHLKYVPRNADDVHKLENTSAVDAHAIYESLHTLILKIAINRKDGMNILPISLNIFSLSLIKIHAS